jgi:carboxymethylenebutenolidase
MREERQLIAAAEGQTDVWLFCPEGEGPYPVVLFYMDGIGVRPALFQMARLIAKRGYVVMLPNLYYRYGPWEPLPGGEAFSGGAHRARMQAMMAQLSWPGVAQDTAAFFSFLDACKGADASRVACIGYCMGGGHALTAAGNHPDRVKAVAAFHAGRLYSDHPDSPHLQLPKVKARLYFGVAGIDPWLAPGETESLEKSLKAARSNYRLEIYPNVRHGYAVPDLPVFDAEAAERHYDRLFALLDTTLGARR